MNLCVLGVILWSVNAFQFALADDGSFSTENARFRCGIRKRFGVPLIYEGRTAELGQWPWHAALYHGEDYKCGGTLIDQHHVLTSAHCVIGKNKRVLDASFVSVQLGKNHLDEYPEQAQIMNVSRIHVHEQFVTNRNDIALLVLAGAVPYSELVIPICTEGIQRSRGEDLAGRRGWVAGFGETESLALSKELKTASMAIVNITECVHSDPELYGRFASAAVFCASDRNGTSVCRGDSGGGVYILEGDRWELRGITSFSGKNERGSCDVGRYVVFTNVAFFYEWIKRRTGRDGSSEVFPKRISEFKCREYGKFARKRQNGVCYNSRSPHTVAIVDRTQRHIASGSIISEKFVLTKAPSLLDIYISEVDRDDLWVRVGNQPDKKIVREIPHPGYDPETLRHQVLLLELSSALTFTKGMFPACLANPATENLYDTLLLNGYSGKSAVDYNFYESVDNWVISNEQCNATVRQTHRKYAISRMELCATDRYEGSTFFWSGIVGGPLQTVNTRSCMFTQIGVTNVLIPHDKSGSQRTVRFTNVYSRVTAYLDWIEQQVWGNETVPTELDPEDDSGVAPMDEDYDYED
ncbi:hypothetical protein quinque_004457 [Culex quinquefasciatus]